MESSKLELVSILNADSLIKCFNEPNMKQYVAEEIKKRENL
jgi:hypothetical protein